jgi:hypothetical protein
MSWEDAKPWSRLQKCQSGAVPMMTCTTSSRLERPAELSASVAYIRTRSLGLLPRRPSRTAPPGYRLYPPQPIVNATLHLVPETSKRFGVFAPPEFAGFLRVRAVEVRPFATVRAAARGPGDAARDRTGRRSPSWLPEGPGRWAHSSGVLGISPSADTGAARGDGLWKRFSVHCAFLR